MDTFEIINAYISGIFPFEFAEKKLSEKYNGEVPEIVKAIMRNTKDLKQRLDEKNECIASLSLFLSKEWDKKETKCSK